jgi:D-glycero-D-manno-heptose 1,7-bisphosphate phosphatase
MAARALLLDRDGVVNIDHGYVGTVERFAFMDGILPLARRAVDLGYRIAIATNQSGIARGRYDEAGFQALTGWMAERFAAAGAPLAAVFHCPYLAGAALPAYDRDSVWRKPAPGMILEAQRHLGLDLARSVFIGDQPTDMAAARAAGVGQRLLLDHGPGHSAGPCVDAHAVISTLAEAERFLVPPAASRPA